MRRRLLDHTYKRTVTGNPAIAKSVARMYPDISFPGFTAQDGEPSPENPVDIVNAQSPVQAEVIGKNIVDIPNIDSNTGNSSTVNCNIEKTVYISCYGDVPVIQSSIWRIQIGYKDGTLLYITDENIVKGTYFNASHENPIVKITYRGTYIISGAYTKIQVEYGNKKTSYEPYKQPQTVTITSDRPITKWDKLIKQNGVWGWEYKSAEYVVTGGETFKQSTGCFSIITSLNSDVELRGEAKCNIAVNKVLPYGENVFWVESSGQQLRFSLTEITTVDELKEYVKNNVVKIIYAKSNTEFVPLSQEEQDRLNALHTNNPTTIVQNSIGTDVTLTYKTKRSLEVTQ